MYLGHKLLTNFIAFLCLVLPVSAASETPLAEEGWRYHGTFRATLQYQGQTLEEDFSKEHMSMAQLIRADADLGQYSSMLRFTPVFLDGETLAVGSTVCLKPIECFQSQLPSYEVAFASGAYSRMAQDWIIKCRTPVDMEIRTTKSPTRVVKRDIMTLRSATHSVGSGKEKEYRPNTYPVRFMVANYVDRGLLEQQLRFRYGFIDNSILARSQSEVVVRPHLEVLQRIVDRKHAITAMMGEMTSEIQVSDTAAVVAHYTKHLTEVEVPPINTHEATNSYTCAEQANLSYLYDHRVIACLQTSLRVDSSNFVGLIVHAHCSHTPCHTCATSFTREREIGGVFSNMALGKRVMVLCSCAEHYKRPAKMLGYEKTPFSEQLMRRVDGESNVLDFSLEVPSLPYPIVKLTYDEITDGWSIDQKFLEGLRGAVEKS